MMKCEGCPFHQERRREHQCWITPSYVKRCADELRYKRCHLTPADFPIIRAMIAGEWKCESCKAYRERGDYCCEWEVAFAPELGRERWPCKAWQPREEER
jgi:hypothetical protein